jgi:hypothetical protein
MNSLIQLFNAGNDFARKVGDSYQASPEARATHKLICTRWAPSVLAIKDVRKRLREMRTRPAGWALSVCAVPLRRRVEEPRGKDPIRLKHPIQPEDMPVYKRAAPLAGKRAVLRFLVKHHATPTKMRKLINTLPSEACDRLYRQLLRANRRARRKLAKNLRRERARLRRAACGA